MHGSGNDSEVQGLAFNLLECVSCETSDRIWFVFICKLINFAFICSCIANYCIARTLHIKNWVIW